MAAVSNLFWVVLLAAMFRVSASFGFDWADHDDLWYKIGLGAHGAITTATLFWMGYTFLRMSQAIDDMADTVDARTFVETDEKSR